jgi:hypothetical protein
MALVSVSVLVERRARPAFCSASSDQLMRLQISICGGLIHSHQVKEVFPAGAAVVEMGGDLR